MMSAKSEDSESDRMTLEIFKRTFECYQMAPDQQKMRDEITELESQLEKKRNGMPTGYELNGKRVLMKKPNRPIATWKLVRN